MYCAYAHSATNLTRGKPFLAEKACTVIAHEHRGGEHLYCPHIPFCKSNQGGAHFYLKKPVQLLRISTEGEDICIARMFCAANLTRGGPIFS